MEMTKEAAKAAVLRALDWLEANPDRHATGNMAYDEYGNVVSVLDRYAYCFCTLGRIAKECNITDERKWTVDSPYSFTPVSSTRPIFDAIGFDNPDDVFSDIMAINDISEDGPQAAIRFLRHKMRYV